MEQYPRQSRAIESALNELSVCEREGSTDLDKTAGCFGKLMEELFYIKRPVGRNSSEDGFLWKVYLSYGRI